jgi:hypothetical protein
MPAYPVLCYAKGCSEEAVYKIASRWSDGVTSELKTFSLACPRCLQALFEQAKAKEKQCRRMPEETLGTPQVFELARGQRDRKLVRREDLEK